MENALKEEHSAHAASESNSEEGGERLEGMFGALSLY